MANNLDQPVNMDCGADLDVEGVLVSTVAEVTNNGTMCVWSRILEPIEQTLQ